MTTELVNQPDAVAVEVRDLLGEVSQNIFTLTRAAADPVIGSIDSARQGVVFMLMNAQGREPDAITAADINRRYPYSARSVYERQLAAAAQLGYLTSTDDGAYRLTEAGHAALAQLTAAFYQRLGELEPMLGSAISIDDLAYTARDVMRLAEACRTASIETWGTRITHGLAPKKPVAALAHIDQAIDDLTAFRDDAHLAAWQPYNISAARLGVIYLLVARRSEERGRICRKSKPTRTLVGSLSGRDGRAESIGVGYVPPPATTQTVVTEIGREIRQAAEDETDRLYYAPWTALNQTQLAELRDRLTRLKAGLAELAEPVPA